MNRNVKYLVIAPIFALILGCNPEARQNSADIPTKPETHYVSIEKVDGVWKAVDDQVETYGVAVNKNDMIVWKCDSSATVFQFPINYEKWFRDLPADTVIKNGYRRRLQQGKELRLKVRPNAPSDTLTYAVLVINDTTLAEGDSVPTVIIN